MRCQSSTEPMSIPDVKKATANAKGADCGWIPVLEKQDDQKNLCRSHNDHEKMTDHEGVDDNDGIRCHELNTVRANRPEGGGTPDIRSDRSHIYDGQKKTCGTVHETLTDNHDDAEVWATHDDTDIALQSTTP